MAAASYQLKSELARVCLPAPAKAVPRRLAWANSVSLLFLLIGILGAQSRMPGRQVVPPLQQAVPVMVEPLPQTPPPTATTETDQQNDDDKPATPAIQAVTIDTPAINFAVPTPGSLVVPLSVAPTPGSGGGVKRKAVPVKNEEPATVQSTGAGGLRPSPVYPSIAVQLGKQGTVFLLLTVDDSGKVLSAKIQKSSGSIILDAAAQKWVERHWVIPPANGGHTFLAPIRYVLQAE